tara:strand:- start:558 stop:734 length:177 start_codon:yes stop_codon:yes gene_type:complete
MKVKQSFRRGKTKVSWEGETAIVETLVPEQEDENYDDKLKAQDHLDEIREIEKVNKQK